MKPKTRKLVKLATDPLQYDRDDISWADMESGINTGTRRFFYDALSKYSCEWTGQRILDIGCGTGWLIHELIKNKAKEAKGIDSSRKNIKKGKRLYPKSNLECSDFNSFYDKHKYDLAISVMALEHMANLREVFSRIYSLLRENGRFQTIVGDYDYFRKPRYGYKLMIKDLNNLEYIERATRNEQSFGSPTSIIRRLDVYIHAGLASGFETCEVSSLTPRRDKLKHDARRFEAFENIPIAHLITFKKHY